MADVMTQVRLGNANIEASFQDVLYETDATFSAHSTDAEAPSEVILVNGSYSSSARVTALDELSEYSQASKAKILRGLSQEGKHYLGSFAEYAD